MSWYETLIVNMAVGTLRAALQKPGQAAKLKHICLDLFQALKTGYADDPDFK